MEQRVFPFQKYIALPAGAFPVSEENGYWDFEEVLKMPLVTILADEQIIFSRNLPLNGKNPLWEAHIDLSAYPCKSITVQIEQDTTDAISSIYMLDSIEEKKEYGQKERPDAHFSWRQGHMGDIVALTYHQKKWHLFTIYNPVSGGEIGWGHAESEDLVHWKEKAPIFDPEHLMFNGIGFVDHENLLGKNRQDTKPLMLMIPRMGKGICYSYSYDGNVFYQDIEPCPAIPYGDAPKLYYSEKIKRWVLFVKNGYQKIEQYLSEDLKSWERTADCPAIAEVNLDEGDPGQLMDLWVDGDPEKKVTVMYFGLGGYALGHYTEKGMCNLNGEPISPSDMIMDGHYGFPAIFSNTPDNRVIGIANLGNSGIGGIPNFEYDYKHIAAFPVEYQLKTTRQGMRLCMLPVREIEKLWEEKLFCGKVTGKEAALSGKGNVLHIRGQIANNPAADFTISFGKHSVHYDAESNALMLLDPSGQILKTMGSAGKIGKEHELLQKLEERKDSWEIEVILDKSSVEVFLDGGRYTLMCGRLNLAQNEEGYLNVSYTSAQEREAYFSCWRLGKFYS